VSCIRPSNNSTAEQEISVTVRHLKAYVQLEIPENCHMNAHVTPSREIFVQLGRLPSENLLVFQNRHALQRFIDVTTDTVSERTDDTDGADATPDDVNTPN
jgi:hypothetical protein